MESAMNTENVTNYGIAVAPGLAAMDARTMDALARQERISSFDTHLTNRQSRTGALSSRGRGRDFPIPAFPAYSNSRGGLGTFSAIAVLNLLGGVAIAVASSYTGPLEN